MHVKQGLLGIHMENLIRQLGIIKNRRMGKFKRSVKKNRMHGEYMIC